MSDASTVALSPETVLAQMKKNGVTHVVWLPDSETNWLYLLMKAEPSLRLVGVSREGHACSIAAGLAAGGRKPLILIQNTGTDGIGRFDPRLALGPQHAGGADGRLPRLDAPRRHAPTPRRSTPSAFSTRSASTITSSKATPTRRAFPSRSKKAARTQRPVACWSATNITASTDRRATPAMMQHCRSA